MIEHQRLDDNRKDLRHAKIYVGILAIAGLAFVLAISYKNELGPFVVLFGLAAPVLTVGIIEFIQAAFSLLVHGEIRATLSVTTDKESYRPGDIVNVDVSIQAEESFKVRRGEATLRYWNGEAWDSKLDSKTEVPIKIGDGQISGGRGYITSVALVVPTDAKTTMDGQKKSPGIAWIIKIALETIPRSRSNLSLEIPVHG